MKKALMMVLVLALGSVGALLFLREMVKALESELEWEQEEKPKQS
jgi:hypothetical protein